MVPPVFRLAQKMPTLYVPAVMPLPIRLEKLSCGMALIKPPAPGCFC